MGTPNRAEGHPAGDRLLASVRHRDQQHRPVCHRAGGIGASNTDPYATGQAPDNEWVVTPPHIMIIVPNPGDLTLCRTIRVVTPPHIMIIVPNPGDLEAMPHDPETGGPYVMWRVRRTRTSWYQCSVKGGTGRGPRLPRTGRGFRPTAEP